MLSSVAPLLLFVLSSFGWRFFLCLYSKDTWWKLFVAGLKGNWSEERWPWNVEALQISNPPPPPPTPPVFLSEFELLRAQPCCSLFYRRRPEKGLAHDVFVFFATHAGVAHDVTDTNCRAQNGGIHGQFSWLAKRGIFLRFPFKCTQLCLLGNENAPVSVDPPRQRPRNDFTANKTWGYC